MRSSLGAGHGVPGREEGGDAGGEGPPWGLATRPRPWVRNQGPAAISMDYTAARLQALGSSSGGGKPQLLFKLANRCS